MEIEKVKINDLLEYKYNAKEHPEWQIEQIVNSIKEFGLMTLSLLTKTTQSLRDTVGYTLYKS